MGYLRRNFVPVDFWFRNFASIKSPTNAFRICGFQWPFTESIAIPPDPGLHGSIEVEPLREVLHQTGNAFRLKVGCWASPFCRLPAGSLRPTFRGRDFPTVLSCRWSFGKVETAVTKLRDFYGGFHPCHGRSPALPSGSPALVDNTGRWRPTAAGTGQS